MPIRQGPLRRSRRVPLRDHWQSSALPGHYSDETFLVLPVLKAQLRVFSAFGPYGQRRYDPIVLFSHHFFIFVQISSHQESLHYDY